MKQLQPIQLVVLDMAGTTVQDRREVERCFLEAAEATGLKTDAAAILPMMGWAKGRVLETLWRRQLGNGAAAADLQANVDGSYSRFKQLLEAHYRTAAVEPTLGCLEVFDWLRSRQIAIALNTGFYRAVTTIILQRLGWDRGLNGAYIGTPQSPIQMSVTPSEIYNREGRPAPYMIQKAMYCLGVSNPRAVIAIGDTPADLQAGHNAHCWTFGVTNGTHSQPQLQDHPHHGLLDSLQELPARVEELTAVLAGGRG